MPLECFHFRLFASALLAKLVLHPGISLMEQVTPPAADLCPPARHGRPTPPPPAATLDDDGGSGYRSNPGRALRDPRGPLSNSLRGWGGPIIEEALGPGDPLLPSAAGVRGGAYYRTGVGDIGWGSTRTEWCISCTCYFPSGSTYT